MQLAESHNVTTTYQSGTQKLALNPFTQQVAALLTIKETGMAAERHCLEEAFKAQTSAVHRVERAAAQVEVSHVRMELEAYKEPWVHLYKNKSPTQNKAITQALGLTAGSMHVCVPF